MLTPSAFGNPFTFQGRRFDPESELYYFRARFYNPATGRFISFDALGYDAGSMNLYEFVNSGPIGALDPSGNLPTAIVGLLGGAAVGGAVGFFGSLLSGEDLETAGVRGLVGAISGAIGGLLGGLGVPVPIVSAIVSAIDRALNRAWDMYRQAKDRGCKVDWDKILEQAFIAGIEGAIMGLAAGGLGALGSKLISKLNLCGKISNVVNKNVCPPVGVVTSTMVSVGSGMAGSQMADAFLPDDTPCFVAGTQVLTDAGSKSIEDIQPGDMVWSRDESTGNEGFQPVVQTFEERTDVLVHLVYHRAGRGKGSSSKEGDRSGSSEVLSGTPEHPFWTLDEGWVPLGRLKPGQRLLLAGGEEACAEVVAFEYAPPGQSFTVYNFEVANWHTYFVAQAHTWVNVHNKCADASGPLRKTKHIENRHINRKKYPHKSKFKKPSQVDKLINKTIAKGSATPQQGNRVRYELDMRRTVGTRGETSVVVVVDQAKRKIVTAFPARP